jgi:hypothetical protein
MDERVLGTGTSRNASVAASDHFFRQPGEPASIDHDDEAASARAIACPLAPRTM